MRKFILATVLTAIAGILLYFVSGHRFEAKPFSKTWLVMSTVAEVKFYGNRTEAEKACEAVEIAFAEIEQTCNIFNPESEISRLNAAASKTRFKCSPLLWEVLGFSRKVNAISGGSFDITVRPLMSLWGFHGKRDEIPDDGEIAETLKKVGLDKVVFDDREHTVFFTCDGMSFDLGGIAKGFAVDKAVERVLQETPIRCGLVNLAGNMRALPTAAPGRKSYSIGVRNPIRKDAVCARIEFMSAIATSGDYERFTVINGRKFSHTMDIRTGRPVEGMIAVTIVTPLATFADGFSGATFVNGEKFAHKLCQEIPGTNILIIKRNADDPQKTDVIKIGSIWGEIRL
jgi:thiamine biosynthesis lipoprotein